MIRFLNHSLAGNLVLLVITETVLLFLCFIAGAYVGLSEYLVPLDYLLYDAGLEQILTVVVMISIGLYFNDLYSTLRPRSRVILFQQYCLSLGFAFLMQAGLGYAKSDLQLPKYTMVYGSMFVLVAAPAWRILFYALVRKSLPAQQVLFVECSPTVQEIVARLDERPELGLRAMGYLSEQPCDGAAPGTPYLGPASDLPQTVQRRRPDMIVVGTSGAELPSGLLDLRLRGLRVEHAATVYETVFDRVSTRDLNVSQMVFTAHMGPSPMSLLLQDIYSFVLGVIGCAIALPVMAIVAVLIKATSPGPVLYRQQRVGRHGKLFTVLKFRSMYSDAEAKTGAVWAQKDDPRITPLGKWLRRLRLDELPQFFNVIRGEMALVGPRPERPEFVAILSEKIPGYAFRHSVKPGITGWAQINHKYGDTIEDSVIKLEYDLYYIKKLTPTFDAYIILHTLRVVLLQRGAQ